jgi:sec-independent protein translocase protein TatB
MGTPPPIELGSLGMADSLILMVLALVVFGPRRLPQIGRQIGKLMFEFRKASNDFKFQMEEELRLAEDAERRKKEEEERKQLAQESVSATPAVVKALESPYPESPNPGEGVYPEVKAVSDVKADSEIKSGETAGAEDVAPRILPPATGEPVASTRVAVDAELTEPAADFGPAVMPLGLAERPDRGRDAQASNGTGDTAVGGTVDEAGNGNAPVTETVSPNG